MRISDWSSDVCSSDLRVEDLKLRSRDRELRAVDLHREGFGGFRALVVEELDADVRAELPGLDRRLTYGNAHAVAAGGGRAVDRAETHDHILGCRLGQRDVEGEDRKSTRLNSSPSCASHMPPSACQKKINNTHISF